MKKIISILLVASMFGCAAPVAKRETVAAIHAEIAKAAEESKQHSGAAAPASNAAVSAALLPPLNIEIPKPKQPLEERFSLAFNSIPAQQFFMAIVTGTRYSMLVHPEVSGVISANLKDVTVLEALDAIREQYGYDYKVEGTRIYVKPLTLQTRVFQVNYLTAQRRGTSEIRVTSSAITDAANPSSPNTTGNTSTASPQSGASAQRVNDSSKISTTSTSDFWAELKASLEAIVGNQEGRSVVISPQSGVVVVRGMWDELQNVAAYLKATQLSVDRQVILEAKILEVQLNDGYQTGINWAAFRNGSSRSSIGAVAPGSVVQSSGTLVSGATAIDAAANTFTGGQFGSTRVGQNLFANAMQGAGTLFGMAFQHSNFSALLSFLETQGTVHVLSSPRIATMNNQKAVLKVGKDELFVTGITSTTTTGTGSTVTSTSPTVTLQPFFSGIALDVTPQIDDRGNIILHIHPSVSTVTTIDKQLNFGTSSFTLPLASSTVSETDSVVRGQDGQIVVLGGLMRQATVSDRSQLPGVGDAPGIGNLFRNTSQSTQKRELVILLKPTVVQGNSAWAQDVLESQRRIEALEQRSGVRQ